MSNSGRYRLVVNEKIPDKKQLYDIEPRYHLEDVITGDIVSTGLPMPIETVLEADDLDTFRDLYPICMMEVEFNYTQLNIVKDNSEGILVMTNQKLDASTSRFNSKKDRENASSILHNVAGNYLKEFEKNKDREYYTSDVFYVTPPYKSANPYNENPFVNYGCSIDTDGIIKFNHNEFSAKELFVFSGIDEEKFLARTFDSRYPLKFINTDSFNKFVEDRLWVTKKECVLKPLLVFFSRVKPTEYLDVNNLVLVKFISSSHWCLKKSLNNDPDIIRRIFTLLRFSFMEKEELKKHMDMISRRGGIRRPEYDMTENRANMCLNNILWYDPVKFYTALFCLEYYVYKNCREPKDRNDHYDIVKDLMVKNDESIIKFIQESTENIEISPEAYRYKYIAEIIYFYNKRLPTDASREILCPYIPLFSDYENTDINTLLDLPRSLDVKCYIYNIEHSGFIFDDVPIKILIK